MHAHLFVHSQAVSTSTLLCGQTPTISLHELSAVKWNAVDAAAKLAVNDRSDLAAISSGLAGGLDKLQGVLEKYGRSWEGQPACRIKWSLLGLTAWYRKLGQVSRRVLV